MRERLPGTIPMDHVNPPRGPVTSPDEPLVASTTSSTHVASAAPDAPTGGFFSNLAHKVGLGGAAADASASVPPQPQPVASAKPRVNEAKHHEPQHPDAAAKMAATPKSDTKQASARPPLKPSVSDTPAAAANETVAGSQPIVQANSFENRFSATPSKPKPFLFQLNRNGGSIANRYLPLTAKRSSARDSTGRVRPGNLPHSGDLSAAGALLWGDSGQAPPPSDKDARWHDRAPAELQRDRRRAVANRSPAAPQRSAPQTAIANGFSFTARSDVRIASIADACRSSINGNATTLMHRATTANRQPTPQPTMMSDQPSGVVNTRLAKSGMFAAGVWPKVAM